MQEYIQSLLAARYLSGDWLYAALLILPYLVYSLVKERRISLSALILSLSYILLCIAVSEPMKVDSRSERNYTALFDVSYSVSPQAREQFASKLQEYSRALKAPISVYPFAESASENPIEFRPSDSAEAILGELSEQARKINTGKTDLGSSLEQVLPQSSSSLLLFSDGFETQGDGLGLSRLAGSRGVRIFPVLPDLAHFFPQGLSLSSLHAPLLVAAGERAEVRLAIGNGLKTSDNAQVEVWLEQTKLLSQAVQVNALEEKLLTLRTPPLEGGLKRIRAVLIPADGKKPTEIHRWISVKEKTKVLLLSGTTEDSRVLKELLRFSGIAVESVVGDGSGTVPSSFEKFSSVIVNNIAKRQLPGGFLPNLEQFAEKGGGVLLIGGDRSYGLGDYINTPLETISPVKFVPPQTKKKRLPVALALVMDKSGSMMHEGKIHSAKLAALMSIQSLKDEDYLAVIGFDHAPFVIIDMKRVSEVRSQAEGRLRNLTAAGQTNLLPALAAARQKLRSVEAGRKHIIVLSDGKFPLSSDAYVAEINRLRADGVTVSAVALGLEADVPFMKILAKYGKGAFYHTLDPRSLPQVFVQDIKVSTGEETLREEGQYPVGEGPSGISSTSLRTFPPLLGFVETLPKKGVQLELLTRRQEALHPILASWSYGKGKVIAFTSDANGRWSQPWLRWAEFSRFWNDVFGKIRDTSSEETQDIEFDLKYSVERGSLSFDLAIFDDRLLDASAPKIIATVLDPGNEPRQVSFRQTKRGRFETVIDNARPGDYRLDISYGAKKLSPVAITLSGDVFGETQGKGVNTLGLERLAQASQGSLNPSVSALESEERTEEILTPLFIPLVIAAFLLILTEALLRGGFFRRVWVGLLFGRLFPRPKRL